MNILENFKNNEYIFSDFDGTISKHDVIHAFITTFSKGDWTVAEKKWCEGKMSTQECLRVQFDMITGLKKKDFVEFVNSIEIDPYFIEFHNYAKKNGKKIIILSDGYDVFIKTTLKNHNLEIPVSSNKLILSEENGFLKFDMEYPNSNKNCLIASGCCKCEVAKTFSDEFTYIGDGLSDRCIAKKSSLLFAKKSLETFCRKEGVPYVSFNTFGDILNAICKEEKAFNN